MKYEGEVRELELIPALVELGSEGFTGALRFENDSIIKIVYFKGGAVLSASTNDRSDSIDEILLKSGKVSRDHIKQALTKRKDEETLGDALLGLGFITRKELSWARRVQLIGILRSVTTWQAGSYTLVADYLPKREDGPTFQLEQIVLELVLTDGDRSKYDSLLDSGAAIFRPSDTFDEQFPRLGLNQEAAAVVRLINGSRTASDVVAESTSDAFNVYKLMHALQLLGLLEKSAPSLDLGIPAGGSRVEPTVEMPMDFGIDVGKSTDDPAAADFDFEKPTGPGVDLSWQEPAPTPSAESQSVHLGEVLPPIDDVPARGFDFEPSVPAGRTPPVVLAEDLPPSPIVDERPIPSYEPPARKPAAPARPHAGGSSGGRKVAFLVVAVVIAAAVAYAGWVIYMKPSAEPVPAAAATARPDSPVSASAAGATTSASEPAVTSPPVAETVTDTVTETVAARPEPVPTPAVAAPATPVQATRPAPAAPTGRLADKARTNAAAARSVPYSLQFAILCQESSVENAMKLGGDDFWFLPIDYQGRKCYRALWGRYASRADAERGVDRIPASLRGGKAVVIEPAKISN